MSAPSLRHLAAGALVIWLTPVAPAAAQQPARVRPANCAGNWYPAGAQTLAKTVDDLLARAAPPKLPGRPLALICPHAGYRFSAPTAAAAYACLRGQRYRRVIVLAFSHRYAGAYQGVDVPRQLSAYATPLGQVPIDRQVCDRLLEHALFSSNPAVARQEHSLELQLPFLQRVLKRFTLVPLYVGRLSESDCLAAARALLPFVDQTTLLVASSDFTHFGPNYGYQPFKDDVRRRLKELAARAAAPLTRCDYDGFVGHLAQTHDTICGRGPIRLLLRILSLRGGAVGLRAAQDCSGRIAGDWTNSVTYQSFVFTRRPATLGKAERDELLRIARRTVAGFLNGQPPPQPAADRLPPALRAAGACFVTLQNHGRLRGCIGNLVADRPLYQAVIRNALSACRDYRFVNNPVTAAELDELRIEISFLTPMKRLTDPDQIVIGRHGLLIVLGGRRGVLLPQVAYQRGWSRAEFLAQTCRKAGLPPDAWKQPEAQIYSFEAEVFGEAE